MVKKGCELCNNPAKMFCESDQASLCWDCDEKVHCANFLVAKHCRTLLCHVCYSPTAWKAAGAKLGPTVSLCHGCAQFGENRTPVVSQINSQESETDDGEYDSSDESDDDDEDDYSEEEEEDEGENQVVPWTEDLDFTAGGGASTSGVEEEEEEEEASLKRIRENPFEFEGEDGSQNSNIKLPTASSDQSSYQAECDENYGSCSSSSIVRPLKMRRTSDDGSNMLSGTAAIIDKLRRMNEQIVSRKGDASAMILGICKLSRDSC